MHVVTSQVGNTVQVRTKSGAIFEGIFHTFSPSFDVSASAVSFCEAIIFMAVSLSQQVVLEMAHKVEENADNIDVESVMEKLVMKTSDIVNIVAKDVDLEFATRDTFETDTAISSRYSGIRGSEEKHLELWDSTGDSMNGGLGESLDDIKYELDRNANGWDAAEMFQKNESLYGVQSTFDHSLAGYTVPIKKTDSQDYK